MTESCLGVTSTSCKNAQRSTPLHTKLTALPPHSTAEIVGFETNINLLNTDRYFRQIFSGPTAGGSQLVSASDSVPDGLHPKVSRYGVLTPECPGCSSSSLCFIETLNPLVPLLLRRRVLALPPCSCPLL